MTQNSYIPPKKSHRARNFALFFSALAVILIVVVVSVATSSGSKSAVPAAAKPSAPSVKVPTVYGMSVNDAVTALGKAGFTQPPGLSLTDGTVVTDASGYTVDSVVDTTGTLSAPGLGDDLTLTLKPTSPCSSNPVLSSNDTACWDVGQLPSDSPVPTSSKVVYKISGPHHGMVTYSDGSAGSTEQDTNASLPWTKTIKDDGSGMSFLYVSAQNSGGGTISCSITRDGTVIASHSSSGEYAIVTCSE